MSASSPADCHIMPCSWSSALEEQTMHQGGWREPSEDSLLVRMKAVYAKRHHADTDQSEKKQLSAHVRRWTWYDTGTSMLQRLKALLEARV